VIAWLIPVAQAEPLFDGITAVTLLEQTGSSVVEYPLQGSDLERAAACFTDVLDRRSQVTW